MKNLKDLSLQETKGLCIAILREELGYKWVLIANIMDRSEHHCRRLYQKFNKIYK
jgi:hypothetical protein